MCAVRVGVCVPVRPGCRHVSEHVCCALWGVHSAYVCVCVCAQDVCIRLWVHMHVRCACVRVRVCAATAGRTHVPWVCTCVCSCVCAHVHFTGPVPLQLPMWGGDARGCQSSHIGFSQITLVGVGWALSSVALTPSSVLQVTPGGQGVSLRRCSTGREAADPGGGVGGQVLPRSGDGLGPNGWVWLRFWIKERV